MKAAKLTIYKTRALCPRIPPKFMHHRHFLLLRQQGFAVVERKLFENHPQNGGTTIPGFTHYVPLP